MCLQVTREIKIHSALRHAHIIDLYAAFEDADNVYLVQEFAYGACTNSALCWSVVHETEFMADSPASAAHHAVRDSMFQDQAGGKCNMQGATCLES